MKIPKILTMYLPQFHRVKENDEWWGEGFTEWHTVKSARPLYEGHEQPIKPVEYYDLLDKVTMEKQAHCMQGYGIDGMCFYHYYFENGKKILEKPAENLLRWKDINMPFCFYWANESWVRSWSNIRGNSWSEVFEDDMKSDSESVLLNQNYGGKAEWKEHFYYLLPFFKDDRYIKHEGHPLFIIYQPQEITCLKEMVDCWNKLMEEEGLSSIYFVGKDIEYDILNGTMIHEPANACADLWDKQFQNEYGLRYYLSYDEIWEIILKKEYLQKNVCLGGFVGYDDTPRRGYNGLVIYGRSAEKFKNYLIRLLIKAANINCSFIFINAWNEWGEGMYLEPDEYNGFKYLEAIKETKDFVNENIINLQKIIEDNCTSYNCEKNEISSIIKKTERYRAYWTNLSKLLNLSISDKDIAAYFIEKGYKNICIYGLGVLGKPLAQTLQKAGINIFYGIDQDVYKGKQFSFPVYTIKDHLPNTDIIIVTVDYAFEKIKEEIIKKINCKIISIADFLDYFMS